MRERAFSPGIGVLAVPLLFAAACAAGAAARGALATGEGRGSGVVRYAFVPDPNGPTLQKGADEEFRPPRPDPQNQDPEYPQSALEAGCGPTTVGLRLVIDPNGAVVEVGDSPLFPPPGGPCGEEFRGASRLAVGAWRFSPAERRRYAPGDDFDGDGTPDFRRAIEWARLMVYVDVRFDFEILGGKGTVSRGPTRPGSRR